MDDTMTTLIRSTLEAKATEIEVRFDDDAATDGPTWWPDASPDPESSRRRPRVLAVAACLAIVAAGVGALVASQDDTDPAAVGSLPSVEATSPPPVDTGSGGTLAPADIGASEVPWMLPATVPQGYELAEIFAVPWTVETRPTVYLAYDVVATGSENPRYGFYVFVESDRDNYEPDPDDDVQVVDGVEYSISNDAAHEEFTVTWRRDGLFFSAGGFVPNAHVLLTAAASIGPVSAGEASTAATTANDRALAQPVYAETTFDDGMRVSVRTMGGIDGAVALCIDEPEPQCIRGDWGPNVDHEGRDQISNLFTVDDERVILRWRLAPGDVTASDGSPVDIVDAGTGWFERVVVAEGMPIPSLDEPFNGGTQSAVLADYIRP